MQIFKGRTEQKDSLMKEENYYCTYSNNSRLRAVEQSNEAQLKKVSKNKLSALILTGTLIIRVFETSLITGNFSPCYYKIMYTTDSKTHVVTRTCK